MALEEKIYISEFNVKANGCIQVRKTTEVLKGGEPIALSYWRCVLVPNDPQAQDVLGAEPYYLNLAQQAWKSISVSE